MTSVALISGAASGIGRACASVMRRSGWQTAGIDLNASVTDLSLRADVSDRTAVFGAVDQVVARFGRIDLLVTAAGYYEEGIDVADITVAQWDRMLGVILGGTVNCCAAVLPHMLSRTREPSWPSPRSWPWVAARPTCTTWRPRARCSA